MYPSGFIATLTGGIALTISSMIAGFLLGKDAIAAVAIGTPIVGIFQALTQMVISGVAVKLAVFAGRGDHRGMNRIFSLGIAETAFLGVFFVAVCQLCATALVNMFGASENASSRTAYMTSLCLEELAADFVAHTPENVNSDRVVMDIKLFSDEDDFKVVIRNSAPAYNPLDFELNGQTFSKVGVKLAQKVSKRIEYTYVYRINIVTIAIAK